MGTEIERKFLMKATPEGLLSDARSTSIEQGYLITEPDGLEVRLRRAGDRMLVTFKHGSGLRREEAEFDVPPDAFDALWPLTEGRRVAKRRFRVEHDGSAVDVDVYSGDLEGLIVAEVEFEDERASRAFAKPAWLGREVTGDERYANQRLASSGRPHETEVDQVPDFPSRPLSGDARQALDRVASATTYRLKRGESAGDGLRRVVLGRLDSAADQLCRGAQTDAGAAVHAARKDLKKARSALRLGRSMLPSAADLDRELRDAGRSLSGPRDAQVRLDTLRVLADRSGTTVPPPAIRAMERDLERERASLAGAGPDGSEQDLLGRLAETADAIRAAGLVLEGLEIDRFGWKGIAPGLERAYRRGRRQLERVEDDPSAQNVHAWRKRVKDLWYQQRLLRNTWKPVMSALADEAHELAELLGDHHDLSVLADDIAARVDGLPGASHSVAAMRRAIEARQQELLTQALPLGRRLYADPPRTFVRRQRAYWRVWRRAGRPAHL